MECFSRKTATFMILGNRCTRSCTFCNVESGAPLESDPLEPRHVAQATAEMELKHAVITSVTRDDLPDGGAAFFAEVISGIRKSSPGTIIEVLIPDFKGSEDSLKKVIDALPDIINHNVETVPRLYADVRPQADYNQSLELLKRIKSSGSTILSKSGLMLGLGESEIEVMRVLKDIRNAGCDIITIGQYLAPSSNHHPVVEYIHPDKFEQYRLAALYMGFKSAASAPLVRSSYLAGDVYKNSLHQL
jgi:lipoic acid synthetase